MEVRTVAEINSYQTVIINPMEQPDQTFELYSVPSFDNQHPEIIKGSEIGSTKVAVEEGDVLICKINPRINRVWVVKHFTEYPLLASSEWIVVRNREIESSYLKWYFSSPTFRNLITSQVAGIGGSLTRAQPKQVAKYLVPIPEKSEQKRIVFILDKVSNLISLRKQQLTKLDELVKARFVELFGDPITNSKRLPTERMELRFNLKAGITTAADDIHDFEKGRYEIPCYGGNGIRGYVKEKSYEGNFPIIGRQGALCGNVQYATGKFHATEHAVLVSLLKDDNEVWVYYLLKLMDLYRYHTGAAQPGLSVKTLNTVDVIVADKCLQNQFAAFVEQTDKSKVAVQKALDEAQLLFDSLMQKYFG